MSHGRLTKGRWLIGGLALGATTWAIGLFAVSRRDSGSMDLDLAIGMYEQGQFDNALQQLRRVETQQSSKENCARALYLEWVINWRLKRASAARIARDRLCNEFPCHPLLAAPIMERAAEAILAGKNDEAMNDLELIQQQFPESRTEITAAKLRGDLRRYRSFP